MTKPSFSFVANKLSQFLKALTQLQWQACKRVLKYNKVTLKHGLMFTSSPIMTIDVYFNANWAENSSGRRSTSGYCVYFGNN